MSRILETVLWCLCGALAISCYFLAGFYGWASILVWTVAVVPLILWRRRTKASGERWPSRLVVWIWMSAAVLSVLVGLGPLFRPRAPRVVEWTMVVAAWVAFASSAFVVCRVTYEALARSRRAA